MQQWLTLVRALLHCCVGIVACHVWRKCSVLLLHMSQSEFCYPGHSVPFGRVLLLWPASQLPVCPMLQMRPSRVQAVLQHQQVLPSVWSVGSQPTTRNCRTRCSLAVACTADAGCHLAADVAAIRAPACSVPQHVEALALLAHP